MSRTVAAVTATTSNDLHLIIGHGPHGPILTTSTTYVPGCITMTRNDYQAFRFYMLQIFRVINQGSIQTKHGNTTNRPYERIAKKADVFKDIVFFLFADIAKLVAPEWSRYEHKQLEDTAVALYSSDVAIPNAYYAIRRPIRERTGVLTKSRNPVIWKTPARTFFDMSVVQRVAASTDHQKLLNFCLNSVKNLDEIRIILKNTRPEELPILLSAKGTAHITHLEALNPPHSFRRTGTALQMAIYADDEGVQSLLKEYMDPAEYERQAIEAFESALPPCIRIKLAEEKASAADYQQAADAQQKEDAKNLCDGLFAAMRAADSAEFIWTSNVTVTTSAAVAAAVNTFKNELLSYTQKNPMHNRYILERLHQINALLEEKSYCFERDCFLSQQGIAEAQLLMSERWVQHYAQGLFYIEKNIDELLLRTSTFRAKSPVDLVDIHTKMPYLRSGGWCLDIFGKGGQMCASGIPGHSAAGDPGCCAEIVSNLVSSKNSMQLELVTKRVQASVRKPEHRCLVS